MLYKYRLLTAQPFQTWFIFSSNSGYRQSRDYPVNDPGHLEIFIKVNGIDFGPYDTGIKTTWGVWSNRHGLNPNFNSECLVKEIKRFNNAIDQAHTALERKEVIVGYTLMEIALPIFNKEQY